MAEAELFEEMLTTYPADKRELARAVYHRFADGDSTEFFSQLFLVLDVYAHYAERIPARMISANADSLATMQELREEICLLAKAIETRDVSITNHAEKTDGLCRVTLAKCDETTAEIELMVKNLGAQVDTKAIVQGINSALESGIRRDVIAPFIAQTEKLAREVMPTLAEIQASAAEAKSEWSKRIWKTAWATSLFWSIGAAIIIATVICQAFASRYDKKMSAQIADMALVMKLNQAAFQKLAVAQVSIQVLPTPNEGGDRSIGFLLVLPGAYAADLRQVEGRNHGCIFFRSSVPEKQIRYLQADIEDPAATNGLAK